MTPTGRAEGVRERPRCLYTERPCLDVSQVCRCANCQSFAVGLDIPPQMEGQLTHGRNCPAMGNSFPIGDESDCTCGLRWRIYLQTEQTMRDVWEKRALTAESEASLARKKEREACIKACCEICANGDQAVKTDAGWCHAGAMPEEYVFCGAEAIHERATRPERKGDM